MVVKSGFEKHFSKALVDTDITYKLEKLPLEKTREDGEVITFRPDFILDLKIYGRTVLVETHGGQFGREDLEFLAKKLSTFLESEEFRRDYYLILVMEEKWLKALHHAMKLNRLKEKDICEVLWWEPKEDTQKYLVSRLTELKEQSRLSEIAKQLRVL